LPAGRARAAVVALHPADNPSRRQLLFDHLARVLPSSGIAVLRYDRRPDPRGRGVPFRDQVADALAGLHHLRGLGPLAGLPVGIWGWSQGAWIGALSATVAGGPDFLILLACTGVTPAAQMRYGTDEHLRRAGFGNTARAELRALRIAFENAIRTPSTRGDFERMLRRNRAKAWFPLAYLPARMPSRPQWPDMDFDPRPVFARVECPVLLFYGERDEWSPIDESIAAWKNARRLSGNRSIRIVRLPGTGHGPTLEKARDSESVSPLYTGTLTRWLGRIGRA